jgi:hypothetical protein
MKLAGQCAEAWFNRFEGSWAKMSTAECRQLENELLDVALADAGVSPLPEGHALIDALQQHNVKV